MRIFTPPLTRVWPSAERSADTATQPRSFDKPTPPLNIFPSGLNPQPLPPPTRVRAEPPFAPIAADRPYEALKAFHGSRPCTVGLHQETGLPSFLYGELHPPVRSPIEDVASFLRRNELMLSGLSEDATRVSREAYYHRNDRVEQISFRQVNKAQVPIYGAHVVCTYSDRQLTFVGSTLFPAEPAQIDNLRWGDEWRGTPGRDDKPGHTFPNLKLIGLPSYIAPIAFEAPRNLRWESREKAWRADRFILPYGVADRSAVGKVTDQNWWLLPDIPLAKQGFYRPVWRVVVVDERGRRWLVLYDAETFAVLSWEPTQVAVTADALAYLHSTDAMSGSAGPSQVSLNFGAGNDIMHADRVHILSGGREMAPLLPGTLGDNDPNRVLTATTFYHIFASQDSFTRVLAGLTYDAGGAASGVNPLAEIALALDNTDGTASYDYQTNTIHFSTGITTGLEVAEPGFDPEVAIHEFTHAVFRYVNPGVFEYQAGTKAQARTLGLDEGTAFYCGCSFANDPRWADFAYAAWAPYRDLTPAPIGLSSVPSDPTCTGYYRTGMWWARVFWALRAQSIQADGLILHALTRLSGPVNGIQDVTYALLDPAELFGSNQIIAQVLKDTGALP